MTVVIDPRKVALTALAVAGDLARTGVSFVDGGGALVSVHDRDVPFVSRLLDLTGLRVDDAGDPRTLPSGHQVVSFEQSRSSHLHGGLAVSWFCEDAELGLADLADFRRVIEDDMATMPGGVQ